MSRIREYVDSFEISGSDIRERFEEINDFKTDLTRLKKKECFLCGCVATIELRAIREQRIQYCAYCDKIHVAYLGDRLLKELDEIRSYR